MIKLHSGKKLPKGRRAFPSIFFTDFSRTDEVSLARQAAIANKGKGKHFSLVLIKGVVKRCSRGIPQVLLCKARRAGGPFPTSFWLVCPHLTRVAGALEARNGVAEMERLSEGCGKSWLRYHTEHALLRLSLLGRPEKAFLRRYRPSLYQPLCGGGVGGMAYAVDRLFVKCLHLQIASRCGMRYHPVERWLDGHICGWECADALCVPIE